MESIRIYLGGFSVFIKIERGAVMKMKDKVVMITGAAGGIGKYLSIRLAEEGALLALCDINETSLKEVRVLCENKGAQVFTKVVAVENENENKAFVNEVVDKFHKIDALINLAIAIDTPHSFLDHTIATLDKSYRTGLVSTWHMMRLCYPHLKETNGNIVNFGSGAGYLGLEGYAAYAAIKEGIRGLSRVVAREWGKDGITVNVVNPGAITDNIKNYMSTLPEEQRDPRLLGFKETAVGHFGDVYKDVAPVIIFLASSESKYLTGQTFNVDGGVVMNA